MSARARGRVTAVLGVLGALAFAARPAHAGQLLIQSGASVQLSNGRIDLGCADLSVGGSLDVGSGVLAGARNIAIDPGAVVAGGSGQLVAAGNWVNFGSFAAGTSSVQLVDGCAVGSSVIRGSNDFATLAVSSQTGKTLLLQAGATQTVTGALVLTGVPGNRLLVRSTSDGVLAYLAPQGAQLVASVDVKDNQAVGATILVDADSVLQNVIGWHFALPIPAFPLLWLLAALLGGVVIWRIARAH